MIGFKDCSDPHQLQRRPPSFHRHRRRSGFSTDHSGGLVTSNNAGLAVPDWPTSEGFWWLPMHKMVGGIKF